MRYTRLGFIFLVFYLLFLGGSAYYALVFPIRVFHHAFVTVVLAVWLWARIRKRQGVPDTPLNLAIFGVVVVWFVSAVASLDPRMAFENLWFPLTHLVFFFALVDLFQRGRQRLVMETQFLMAALVVFISGLELASWYFGLGITPGTDVGWANVSAIPLTIIRLSLAMNISTLLAGYVAPLITLAIGWALTARRPDYRRVLWILAGLLGIVLVLTFSRGGLISVITALGALVAMRVAQMPRVIRRIPARVVIGGTLTVGSILVIGFVLLTASQSRRSGDEGRVDMWNGAVSITRDHLVLGVGPGLFGRAFRDYRDPTIVRDKLASAHNAYLNTAAETGLIGTLVSLWLGFVFLRTTWRTWQISNSSARKLRVEAAFAALLGVGVHNLVDAFTTTPLVLVILLLAAYCVVGHRSRLDTPVSSAPRWTAFAALVIILGYGVWFVQLDRAQSHYQNSLSGDANALDEARAAADIDPYLRLYPLQIAYLTGQKALDDPKADWQPAIDAYQHALDLEPSWDTGWINLAALVARQGDNARAMADLEKAGEINNLSTAALHWARLADDSHAASESEVVSAYVQGAALSAANSDLPLADFWSQSALRKQAVDAYLPGLSLDLQYRVLVILDPTRAFALVPTEPQSADQWWVVGEYALTVQNDPIHAGEAFSHAIDLAYTTGDYYVSRARAEWRANPDAAEHDLKVAQLLGTQFEYPNAVRALMATTPNAQRSYEIAALPSRSVGQEFAAVLYDRPAVFDVFPEMRRPGPGHAALLPWYTLAAQYIADGQTDKARQAYQAILDYAPYETDAQAKLRALNQQP